MTTRCSAGNGKVDDAVELMAKTVAEVRDQVFLQAERLGSLENAITRLTAQFFGIQSFLFDVPHQQLQLMVSIFVNRLPFYHNRWPQEALGGR